jgi:hypothetical protein
MSIYDIQKRLNSLRFSRLIWMGLVIALNVAVAVVVILFPTIWSFYIMMISTAVFTLLVPYMFGEKSIKKLAVFGLVLITISGVIAAYATWQVALDDIYSEESETVGSDDGLLADGTSAPYFGYGVTNFTFTVTYTGGWSADDVQAYVNITPYLLGGENARHNVTMAPEDPANVGLTPRPYVAHVELDEKAIYMYQFIVVDGNSTAVTEWNLGPINVEKSEAQPTLIMVSTMIILLQSGMLFLIGLLMYWWLRKGKQEREKWRAELEESKPKKGGGFKCTSCGAEVGDDDKFCPKCGEKFEESGGGAANEESKDGQAAAKEAIEPKPVEYADAEKEAGEGKET